MRSSLLLAQETHKSIKLRKELSCLKIYSYSYTATIITQEFRSVKSLKKLSLEKMLFFEKKQRLFLKKPLFFVHLGLGMPQRHFFDLIFSIIPLLLRLSKPRLWLPFPSFWQPYVERVLQALR